MLEDTCYFLSFDTLESALIVWTLLNLVEIKEFLNSLIFTDEKRPVTKDILMLIASPNERDTTAIQSLVEKSRNYWMV